MIEYFVVFILLVFTGIGLPVPEESVLLLAAYLAATGSNAWFLVLTAVLGIAVADTICYLRGRVQSNAFAKFKRGRQFIDSTGFFAVFMARLIISTRTVLPFMAGAMRMHRSHFHAASILSAIVTSLILIAFGSICYAALAAVTAYAAAIWMLLIIIVTGVLMMYATRNQVKLAKD